MGVAVAVGIANGHGFEGLGITKNLSIGGALVSAAGEFHAGDRVELSFPSKRLGDGQGLSLCGVVTRARAIDALGLWRSELAIKFDDTDTRLEPLLGASS